MMLAAILCLHPWVIDGDSIRCSNIGEIRLLGIDAPDYRDSPPCRGHFGDHVCDDRGARLAKLSLIRAKRLTPWTVEPVTHDRYGRTVASVSAGPAHGWSGWSGQQGPVNLSCWQLRAHVARYIAHYDNGGRIARACR